MVSYDLNSQDNRVLEILGVSPFEETIYRWLVERSGAKASEIAEVMELSVGRAQRLLESMVQRGLATYSPEASRHYIAVSPNIVMNALIVKRRKALQDAESEVHKLQALADAPRGQSGAEHTIELITTREVEQQIFDNLHRSAEQEIVTLVRPPILISRMDVPPEEGQKLQREAKRRGVRYRSIVDAEFMGIPGAASRVRADAAAGEEVRVISKLPIKMTLADRRVALIPLNLEEPGTRSLLVRSSALLDALYVMFESFWAQAALVAPDVASHLGDMAPALETGLPASAQELIWLLTTGLNDKGIAHEAGLSASTLQRRMRELMAALDARSRFQLGWIAALRLHGLPVTDSSHDGRRSCKSVDPANAGGILKGP